MHWETCNETTFPELWQSAVEAFPKTKARQHIRHEVQVDEFRFLPYLGVKTLFVRATATNQDRQYQPIILFKNVNYNPEDNIVTLKADSKNYKIEKIQLESADVLVRCSCLDFFWRFHHYDFRNKSLYGSNRKKYESQGGPAANPMKKFGLCKHVMKMGETLQERGIVI